MGGFILAEKAKSEDLPTTVFISHFWSKIPSQSPAIKGSKRA